MVRCSLVFFWLSFISCTCSVGMTIWRMLFSWSERDAAVLKVLLDLVLVTGVGVDWRTSETLSWGPSTGLPGLDRIEDRVQQRRGRPPAIRTKPSTTRREVTRAWRFGPLDALELGPRLRSRNCMTRARSLCVSCASRPAPSADRVAGLAGADALPVVRQRRPRRVWSPTLPVLDLLVGAPLPRVTEHPRRRAAQPRARPRSTMASSCSRVKSLRPSSSGGCPERGRSASIRAGRGRPRARPARASTPGMSAPIVALLAVATPAAGGRARGARPGVASRRWRLRAMRQQVSCYAECTSRTSGSTCGTRCGPDCSGLDFSRFE